MFDIREYKETIKRAVSVERISDKNWSWRVKSITKKAAKIGWGYLDYVGEKDAAFVVEVEDMDGSGPCVVGTMPNGYRKYAFVGPNHWDDATTVEKAIALVIKSMASSAHNTY